MFSVPWSCKEFVYPGGPAWTHGTCSDAQEYELDPWIRQGTLYWLDKQTDTYQLVNEPVDMFPYKNIPGRRHPYTIKNGKVSDLPDPVRGPFE